MKIPFWGFPFFFIETRMQRCSFFWKYVQVNISFLPTGDRTHCPGQMVLL